eukprot:TRINITY_DN34342_c0_g1_i1.p1 TRINITY_DN34342_c0_g1~~TRINITY_DN34342_c0_g1_i1.p1  ORF type:complete len:192 (-),score=43.27 TRINITY_DN34342_c0_g1_i1:210-746(-)
MGVIQAKLRDLFANRRLELAVVGLENSGKTTLLGVLSGGQPQQTLPTIGLNVKQVTRGGVKMKAWDMGGQERFRKEWGRYTQGCDVILFVVDASDPPRLPIARKELHALLEESSLNGIPLLIVLNKIDIEPHATKEDAIRELNLDYISDHDWLVISVSALKQINVVEVVDWLVNHSKK